jgi:hypothetical protein
MKEFPINSQTSDSDKEVLLTIRNLLGSAYSYLEIGSYLGGSLTPFLQDENCVKILSIDDRGRQQPDERGAKYDYGRITHDTMIQNLHSHGFDTTKLEVFDGSVDQYTGSETYDFIFIDGEHTDWACFRDFVHAEKFFKKDCIVAFHDTQLIYKSIKIINELLRSRQDCVKFVKVKNSGMSCLFFNKFSEVDIENLFLVEQDLEKFYDTCEERLLLEVARNRVEITGHSYKIKPIPVLGL